MKHVSVNAHTQSEWKEVTVRFNKPGEGACVNLDLIDTNGDSFQVSMFYGGILTKGPAFLQKLKDAFAEASAPCPACGREGDV